MHVERIDCVLQVHVHVLYHCVFKVRKESEEGLGVEDRIGD